MNDATNSSNESTNTNEASTGAGDEATLQVVRGKENVYFFKTKDIKDDDGNVISKDYKHPDVKVLIPEVKLEEVINYLAAPDNTPEAKVRDMIMDLLFDAQVIAGRRQINEFLEQFPDKQFAATNMDVSKLSLQSIADTPKSQRGAWAPEDADFKSFIDSYSAVLVHKVNYDPKKVKTHCDHWKSGMGKVKTNKPVVAKLKEFLTLYAANAEPADAEENAQTYNWLMARANKYLKAEERNHLEAL